MALAWQPEVSPVHTNLPLVYKQGVTEWCPLSFSVQYPPTRSLFVVPSSPALLLSAMHPSCLRKWNRDSCQEPASKAPTGWGPYPCCLPFIEPTPCFCDLVFLCPCVCYFLPLYHPAFPPFSLSAALLSLRFPWLWALLLSLFLMWQDS